MTHGAIFDLDGVLLDSMIIWREIGLRYLAFIGIKGETTLGKMLFSMSMEQGAAYLKERYALPMTEKEILRGLGKMLEHFYSEEVQAKPGAYELLDGLKRAGIKMAVATSSPRDHVTRALTRLRLMDFMEAILTTGEIGESKHSPRIYRIAAEFLGTKNEETVVFEDSLYALKTAKNDGFMTVGVRDTDGEPDQQGLRENADCYLEELSDFSVAKIL